MLRRLTRCTNTATRPTANATSGAGIPRGADFSGSASGNYTITAGGTDFWDVSDHGSAIFDSTATPVTGDFSAVVQVSIGLAGEVMPGEWGRCGIMARTDPSAANSAYFASTQKFDGPNQHVLQFRDSLGCGHQPRFGRFRDHDGHRPACAPTVSTSPGLVGPASLWRPDLLDWARRCRRCSGHLERGRGSCWIGRSRRSGSTGFVPPEPQRAAGSQHGHVYGLHGQRL